MRFRTDIYAVSLLLLAAAPVYAGDSFRCGSHLVHVGDERASVLEHCGRPAAEEDWNWIYNRGPELFKVYIHFGADGKVDQIKEGDEMGEMDA